MNYIAHIHLAQCTGTSMLGNFLGDFVKGELVTWSTQSSTERLQKRLIEGVALHRSIDKYTDTHSINVALRRGFPVSIRRMAGVALDIYYDHLLCKHWARYTDMSLVNSLQLFYQELSNSEALISTRFQKVKHGLVNHEWLEDYRSPQGCLQAFKHIEQRLNYRVVFASESYKFLVKNHVKIEQQFLQFYPELIEHALQEGCKL